MPPVAQHQGRLQRYGLSASRWAGLGLLHTTFTTGLFRVARAGLGGEDSSFAARFRFLYSFTLFLDVFISVRMCVP